MTRKSNDFAGQRVVAPLRNFASGPRAALAMINPAIVRLVCFCARHRWMVVIVGILLTIGAGTFAAAKFSINTDVEGLISENIPGIGVNWNCRRRFRKRALQSSSRRRPRKMRNWQPTNWRRALQRNRSCFRGRTTRERRFLRAQRVVVRVSDRRQKGNRWIGGGRASPLDARWRSEPPRRHVSALDGSRRRRGTQDQAGPACMAPLPGRSHTE